MNENFNPNFNGGYNGGGNYGGSPSYEEFFLRENERKKDKKIIGKIGKMTAGAIIFYMLSVVLIGIVLSAVLSKFPTWKIIIRDFSTQTAIAMIESILFIGIPFLVCYMVMRRKKITGIMPLGTFYNTKAAIYLDMIMLPVTLLTTIAINYISLIFQSLTNLSFESGLEDITFRGPKEITMAILGLVILPALVEEIAIRGVVLQPLRRYGDIFAIVVSALIFSLMHGNMVQTPYTFIGGIYFGFVAVATGSIWSSVILHLLNNLFSVIITIVHTSLGLGAANTVVLIMLGTIIAMGIVGIIMFKNMNYKIHLAKGVDTLKLKEKLSAFFGNIPMVIAGILVLISLYTSIK